MASGAEPPAGTPISICAALGGGGAALTPLNSEPPKTLGLISPPDLTGSTSCLFWKKIGGIAGTIFAGSPVGTVGGFNPPAGGGGGIAGLGTVGGAEGITGVVGLPAAAWVGMGIGSIEGLIIGTATGGVGAGGATDAVGAGLPAVAASFAEVATKAESAEEGLLISSSLIGSADGGA
ncbi:MAG: hypothetical protein AAB686_01085 [Patescibacteria group bacterium]